MIEFVLANIAMIAVGVILFVIARSLPRIGEVETSPKSLLERWITSEVPEKLDTTFNSFAGKFLRKLRVIILKVDNAVSISLKRFKQENGNGKTLDVKEMMEREQSFPEKDSAKKRK